MNTAICDLVAEARDNQRFKQSLDAIRSLQLALFLEKKLDHPSIETFELNQFAGDLISTIDFQYGLEFYQKATQIISEIPDLDVSQIFIMYTSRAGVHGMLAQNDSAVYYYRQAIEIAVDDTPVAEVSSINNLGVFFHEIGIVDSAKLYFSSALSMMESKKYSR